MVSGAPSTNLRSTPFFSKVIELQRRAELNGIPSSLTAPFVLCASVAARAFEVLLSSSASIENAPSQLESPFGSSDSGLAQ